MKYVVDSIANLILINAPESTGETMIRVDGLENISMYEKIASKVKGALEAESLTVDIKLARNKWRYFKENSSDSTVLQSMQQHGWVADAESITYYRNLHQSNVLVLLGTEDEEDKGGLLNCYSITPEHLIKSMNGKYHEVFGNDIELLSDNDKKTIDRLYKDLFEFVPIDICKLSDMADSWTGRICNISDFIELFFENLPYWGIPKRKMELPSFNEINGRKNYLRSSYNFIQRHLFKKISMIQYKKYNQQIDYYNSGEAELAKYTTDNECWQNQSVNSYEEFSNVLKEFIRGENASKNKEILLDVDFSIVEDVLDIGMPSSVKPPKNKITTLVGEPLEVFTQALFLTLAHIVNEQITIKELNFEFNQAEIVCMYSNTQDEEEKQHLIDTWRNICIHCNGIITYLNKRMWCISDNEVFLKCIPENFFSPVDANIFIDEEGLVRAANANRTISKISFCTKYLVGSKTFKQEYQWKFEANNSWVNNFKDLCLQNFSLDKGGNYIPVVAVPKINSLIFSKSDDEFFDRLEESDVEFGFNLSEYVDNKVPNGAKEISVKFDELGRAFSEFVYSISNKGFYTCIGQYDSELARLVKEYTELGEYLIKQSLPDNLKWVLDAYILSFNLIEKTEIIDYETEANCCIVPAWHPATLEKINDQKIFFLDGCEEWWYEVEGNILSKKITNKDIEESINNLIQMSMIQSALDIFPSYGQQYFGSMASFGSYSLYGRSDLKNDNRLKDMIHKDAIYDDDFDNKEISKLNDNAKMIYGVLEDYVKAFPESANNLSVVFVDPSELQPIVASLYKYIDVRRKNCSEEQIDIAIKILVKPENKGGRNYLAYWMDEFFSQDSNVNIRTYLNEWKSKSELEKILNGNNDIVFVMDILKVNNLSFVRENKSINLAASQCRFPIVFKPTPVSCTSVKRTIELSQPQFRAAYEHTQVVRYRNNMEKVPDSNYLAAKEVGIDDEGQSIVYFLHEKAYWVVCVDSGMDGALLRNDGAHKDDYSIIGFSTGKGAYGQYNLTITARKSILETIRKKLENRLYQLFHWDKTEIKYAAKLCMDEASGLDGISLLSAINQKDHNINEFMAYVMTSLREEHIIGTSALKIVIHLDSYKHWFGSDIENDEDNSSSRPDFLVLEVFLSDNDTLILKATVIECKIATVGNSSQHKEKAEKQVRHGIKRLSKIFDPESRSIKRRYWYAQLYRALAFAQITFSNNTDEFADLSAKLRTILDGNFEIEWSGKVLGYWLDMDGKLENVTKLDKGEICIYDIPQKKIQSLLLTRQEEELDFVKLDSNCYLDDEERSAEILTYEEELEKEINDIQTRKRMSKDSTSISITGQGGNIPSENDEIVPGDVTAVNEIPKADNDSFSDSSNSDFTDAEVSDNLDDTSNNDSVESRKNENIAEDLPKSLDEVRVLIGTDKLSQQVYWEFGNSQLANRHILITGTSGQGKTYSIQTMLYELSKSNISSVVFDYTEGFRLDQLESEFVEGMDAKIAQHIVKVEGVPINPFKKQELEFSGIKIPEEASDVAGRFANILTHVYGFGEQQHASIYEATRIGLEKYGDDMNMEHFKDELEEIQTKNSSAKTVVSKMTPFFHSVKFDKNADFDWESILYCEDSKMNIFQLTLIDREMQVIVTELMLWDAWYYTKKYGSKDKPFVVVLDEAQNLSHKENSPSKVILTEGRKFGWSAWFATQSLRVLADDEVVRLMQSAFKLYFKPTDEEIVKMSKQLDPSNGSLWIGALKGLRKGQCIVVGERIKADGRFGVVKPTVTNITSFKERNGNG